MAASRRIQRKEPVEAIDKNRDKIIALGRIHYDGAGTGLQEVKTADKVKKVFDGAGLPVPGLWCGRHHRRHRPLKGRVQRSGLPSWASWTLWSFPTPLCNKGDRRGPPLRPQRPDRLNGGYGLRSWPAPAS